MEEVYLTICSDNFVSTNNGWKSVELQKCKKQTLEVEIFSHELGEVYIYTGTFEGALCHRFIYKTLQQNVPFILTNDSINSGFVLRNKRLAVANYSKHTKIQWEVSVADPGGVGTPFPYFDAKILASTGSSIIVELVNLFFFLSFLFFFRATNLNSRHIQQ